MHMARPALLVSLFLVALTLMYNSRWAGNDPRMPQQPEEVQLATAGDAVQ